MVNGWREPIRDSLEQSRFSKVDLLSGGVEAHHGGMKGNRFISFCFEFALFISPVVRCLTFPANKMMFETTMSMNLIVSCSRLSRPFMRWGE